MSTTTTKNNKKSLHQKLRMKKLMRSNKEAIIPDELRSMIDPKNPDAKNILSALQTLKAGDINFANLLQQTELFQNKHLTPDNSLTNQVNKLRAANCKPDPVIVRTMMSRILQDNTLTDEQKDKLRAMIILYQQDHPDDPLTSDWASLNIPPSLVLSKKVFTPATQSVCDDNELSDLSE